MPARPWITWGLMALCIAVFFLQVSQPQGDLRLVYAFGLIPATLTGEAALLPELYRVPPIVTLVTYPFLHGSLLHLGGNMLYLWIFGDNVEDSMGHGRFLLFYLLGGVLAGLAQSLVSPLSDVPTIGASGAVAAVLGAYLLLHPRARILVPILYIPLYLPAYLLLLVWFAFNLLPALSGDGGDNIAWWAHIGGFLAGLLLVVPFRRKEIPLLAERPSGTVTFRRGPWRRRR
jgi:membrane associated rhomboid family serine protease